MDEVEIGKQTLGGKFGWLIIILSESPYLLISATWARQGIANDPG